MLENSLESNKNMRKEKRKRKLKYYCIILLLSLIIMVVSFFIVLIYKNFYFTFFIGTILLVIVFNMIKYRLEYKYEKFNFFMKYKKKCNEKEIDYLIILEKGSKKYCLYFYYLFVLTLCFAMIFTDYVINNCMEESSLYLFCILLFVIFILLLCIVLFVFSFFLDDEYNCNFELSVLFNKYAYEQEKYFENENRYMLKFFC